MAIYIQRIPVEFVRLKIQQILKGVERFCKKLLTISAQKAKKRAIEDFQ